MALPDLTGQQIQDTYQRVLQTDGSILYDGTGSVVDTLKITGSFKGDGSGLTNIPPSSINGYQDRIESGTSRAVISEEVGFQVLGADSSFEQDVTIDRNLEVTGQITADRFIGGFGDGGIQSILGSALLLTRGFKGQTSASLGLGPSGFVFYSGSATTQLGADTLQGTGFKFVGTDNSSSISFSDQNGGDVEIRTDKFTLQNSGDITASNALFSGTAIARNFIQKSVILSGSDINSSPFDSYLSEGVGGYSLYLDGTLGGEIVNNVEFALPLSGLSLADIVVKDEGSLTNDKITISIRNRNDSIGSISFEIRLPNDSQFNQVLSPNNIYTFELSFDNEGQKTITPIAATDLSIPVTASNGFNINGNVNIDGSITATNQSFFERGILLNSNFRIDWGGTNNYIAGTAGGVGGGNVRIQTGGSERLRIDGGGNVGIGTTSPLSPLHVVGGIRSDDDITFTGTGFIRNNPTNIEIETVADDIILTPSLNVGIGTTSPSYKLDVSGSGKFTDGLTVTGSFNVSESIVGESDSIKTWTIDLANSFYVNGQDANPTGVWFDPTGSRMYMCGYSTNDIFEYSLTTPWDVLTATYTGKQFDFNSTNGSTTEGMYISPDGVECYAIGRSGDRISRYRFSTPWDVSTLSFSQSLNVGFGGTPRLNLEDNPTAVHFKYDGSILYFMGYTNDTIYQVPLTTPWDIDISNHGTITSQSINPPHGTPQGMSLSQDGTTLLLIGYSADRITKYSLSTPYDVRTLTQVEQSPYYGYIASTPTNIYWNETYNKAYIVGRSSDRIFQVKTDNSIEITKPLLSTNDLILSGSFTTFNTGRFLFRNPGDFGNSVNFRSTFSTYSTTRLTYTTSGTVDVGNTTYGNLNFRFARNNYYPNSLTATGATFDIIRNQFGGKGRLRIGIPGSNNESYFSGTRGIGGTTHITSDADTFDHFGSFTLGGELQVSGSSREVFLTKQEDLYSTLTPIVLDTFTEASDTDIELHTPDTGSGYSLEYSSSGVAPDDLPIVSAGNGWMQPERDEDNDGYIYTNDTVPSIADYEVRATIRRQQSSDDTFWIFFRYVDEDNFYGLQIANNTSYTALWKKVGGTSTRLSYLNYYVNTSTADGINIDVAVRGIGDKITIFYEGEYRGTWIDSDITSVGKAGFGFGSILQDQLTSQEIDDHWRISEFRVTEFPSSSFSPDDSVHYIKHGNVGIGTTSPSYKLDVSGSGRFTDGLTITGSINQTGDLTVDGIITAKEFHTEFVSASIIYQSGSTKFGDTADDKHEFTGSLDLSLGGLSGASVNPFTLQGGGGQVRFDTTNTVYRAYSYNLQINSGIGNSGTSALFTSYNYGGINPRVGIGTTTPSYKLDVNGTFRAGSNLSNNSVTIGTSGATIINTTSGNTGLTVNDTANGIFALKGGSQTYRLLTLGSSQRFEIRDLTNADATRLAITSTGNVGIGTTSPSEKLDVSGSAFVKDNLYLGNSSTLALKNTISSLEVAASSQYQLLLRFGIGGSRYMRLGAWAGDYGRINYKDLEQIYLGSSGQVGVGTLPTSAAHRFVVSGSANQWGVVSLRGMTDSLTPTSYYYAAGNAHNFTRTIITNNNISIFDGDSAIDESGYRIGNNDGILNIGHIKAGVTQDNTVFNISGSSVGIGTTSPSDKLQVDGRVRIKSNDGLYIDTSNSYGAFAAVNFEVINDASSNPVLRILNAGNGGFRNISINTYGGKLGIGTLNPTTTLHIKGSGTTSSTTALRVEDANASGSMVIRDDGKVGIGTDSPSALFHLSGKNSSSRIEAHIGDTNGDTTNVKLLLGRYNGGSSVKAGYQLPEQNTTNQLWTEGAHPTSEYRVNLANYGKAYYEAFNDFSATKTFGFVTGTPNSSVNGVSNFSASMQMFVDGNMALGLNGNVGIGTTSPSEKLHVSGSLLVEAGTDTPYIKGSQLRISSQTNGAFGTLRLGSINDIVGDIGNYQFKNGSTTLMTIKNTGNVGIGTTSPSSKLHVYGTNDLIQIGDNTSGNDAYISLNNRGFIGFDASGGMLWQATTTRPFNIAHGLGWGTSLQSRLYIDLSGNVGIGTTSPSSKLHVSGANATNLAYFQTPRAQYKFYSDSTSTYTTLFNMDDTGLDIGHNSSVRAINLKTNDTDRLTILGGGNVGIGTTSPSQKLDVNGNIKATKLLLNTTNTGYTLYSNGESRINGVVFQQVSSVDYLQKASGTGDFYVRNSVSGQRILVGASNSSNQFNNYLEVDGANNDATIRTNNVDRLYISSSGNVGIGTTSPSEKLDVNGTVQATAFVETSARRFKENIKPIEGALDKVVNLQGVTFNRIGEEKHECGFIADEVKDIVPELVTHNAEGEIQGVHYARTVAILTEAIKELDNKLKAQQIFINDLVARIEKLENK